jgi:hypothetical protein
MGTALKTRESRKIMPWYGRRRFSDRKSSSGVYYGFKRFTARPNVLFYPLGVSEIIFLTKSLIGDERPLGQNRTYPIPQLDYPDNPLKEDYALVF